MKIFVYGTLKKGYPNDFLLRNCEFLCEDSIEGFEMRGLKHFPAINKVKKGIVYGEVYSIGEDVFKRLDRLEGYPSHYNREIVKTVKGKSVWVYFYQNNFSELPLIECGVW